MDPSLCIFILDILLAEDFKILYDAEIPFHIKFFN